MKLSVLITYHNEGQMLRDCLDSLAAQTRPVDEILVYDDASSIPPQPHIPPHLPVRVIRGGVNRGPAHGRNRLLEEATGDGVHFHDADDWFHPEWAQSVLAKLASPAVEAVFTDVTGTQGRTPVFSEGHLDISQLSRLGIASFCLRWALLLPSGTYRTLLARELGGFDEGWKQSEDFDFYLRLAQRDPKFETIAQPLVCISRHGANWSGRHEKHVWHDGVRILQRHAPALLGAHREELADAAAKFGSRLFQIGEPQLSREAFRLALEWGPPTYPNRPPAYRATARLFGPYVAEHIGRTLRRLKGAG